MLSSPLRYLGFKSEKPRESLPDLDEHALLKPLSQPTVVKRGLTSIVSPQDFKLLSSDLQSNPKLQDFAIVDGKRSRVNRSPKITCTESESIDDHSAERCPSDGIVPSKRALNDSNLLTPRQSSQTLKQVRQIERLTQHLHLDHTKQTENLAPRRVTSADSSNITDNSAGLICGRQSNGLPARRRAEAIESSQKMNILDQIEQHSDLNTSLPLSLHNYNSLEHLAPDNGLKNCADDSQSLLHEIEQHSTPTLRKRSSSVLPAKGLSAVHGDDMSPFPPPITRKQISIDMPTRGTVTPSSEEVVSYPPPMSRQPDVIVKSVKAISVDSTVEDGAGPPLLLRKMSSRDVSQQGSLSSVTPDISPTNKLTRKRPSISDSLVSTHCTSNHDFLTPVTVQATTRPPRGLVARLSMGSREKSKVVLAASTKRRTSAPLSRSTNIKCGSVTARTATTDVSGDDVRIPCTFLWKTLDTRKVHLFIAHDNPQVGNTVALRVENEGSLHVMIETKAKCGATCFILASIIYSGCVEGVEAVDLEKPRGSQFIVCSCMTAMRVDLATLPKRTNGDILEIDLQYALQHGAVDISSDLLMKDFLSNCIERVNIILDPSHTQLWYPYFEGTRKMAPQFRSKGVGYIRLGDEFSAYGTAFLSLDAGISFLDNGATSIVADADDDNTSTILRTFPGGLLQYSDIDNSHSLQKTDLGAILSKLNTSRKSKFSFDSYDVIDQEGQVIPTPSSGVNLGPGSVITRNNDQFSLGRETDFINDALLLLSDADLKWSNRVEALRQLHSALINISNNCPSSSDGLIKSNLMMSSNLLKQITSVLVLTITKQTNTHVLRSAVCCVRVSGAFASSITTCGVMWRALLLETMHLLRSSSKPVYEEAKDTLHGLQLGAAYAAKWTVCLHQLYPMLGDLFAGPKKSGVACNSFKVVQWLESITCNEIDSYVEHLIFRQDGKEGTKLCDHADIGAILSKCSLHLVHREEVTREAAVALCASLLVCDVMQTAGKISNWETIGILGETLGQRLECTFAHQKNRGSGRLSLNLRDEKNVHQPQNAIEIQFISALSQGTASAVNDLSSNLRRMCDRVIEQAILLLLSKINDANANRLIKNAVSFDNDSSDTLKSNLEENIVHKVDLHVHSIVDTDTQSTLDQTTGISLPQFSDVMSVTPSILATAETPFHGALTSIDTCNHHSEVSYHMYYHVVRVVRAPNEVFVRPLLSCA